MKIVSWNLNGLSSCIQNNSFAPIADIGPDILCLQEIRTPARAADPAGGTSTAGITDSEMATRVPLCSTRKSRFLYLSDWAMMMQMKKAAPSF